MSDKQDREPLERMVAAYETMLERAHDFIESAEEKTAPVIKDALLNASEKAVELGELTREEAQNISRYIERDVKDAAEFLVETGQDFRDWFRFDVELMEKRLFDMLLGVADQTSVQLRELATRAERASHYRTGEIVGPGALKCESCGEEIHFRKTGRIPPCPVCKGSDFRRLNIGDLAGEGVDQGDIDGD